MFGKGKSIRMNMSTVRMQRIIFLGFISLSSFDFLSCCNFLSVVLLWCSTGSLQDGLIHRNVGESRTTVEGDSNLPLNLTIFQTVVVLDIMHCRCVFLLSEFLWLAPSQQYDEENEKNPRTRYIENRQQARNIKNRLIIIFYLILLSSFIVLNSSDLTQECKNYYITIFVMSYFLLINALDDTISFFVHTYFLHSLIDCSLSFEAAV